MEERQPVVIRSPVDSGPQKIRRRYTKPIVGILGSLVCTGAELDQLWNFFDVTLQGGVKEFILDNPITGINHNFRFLQPPRVTAYTDVNYNVEVILEQL